MLLPSWKPIPKCTLWRQSWTTNQYFIMFEPVRLTVSAIHLWAGGQSGIDNYKPTKREIENWNRSSLLFRRLVNARKLNYKDKSATRLPMHFSICTRWERKTRTIPNPDIVFLNEFPFEHIYLWASYSRRSLVKARSFDKTRNTSHRCSRFFPNKNNSNKNTS